MTLKRAIEIAAEAHKDQPDKVGNPYILHLMSVMNKGRNEKEKIAGILHDLVEDTSWTFDDLRKEGFDEEIVTALSFVTKNEDEEYDAFIARIKTNPLAIRVKINDLEDNMDIRRLPEVTEKDMKRMNKYLKAYRELTQL